MEDIRTEDTARKHTVGGNPKKHDKHENLGVKTIARCVLAGDGLKPDDTEVVPPFGVTSEK